MQQDDREPTLDRIERIALQIRQDVSGLHDVRQDVAHIRRIVIGDSAGSDEAGLVTRHHVLSGEMEAIRARVTAIEAGAGARHVASITGRWQVLTACLTALVAAAVALFQAIHQVHHP